MPSTLVIRRVIKPALFVLCALPLLSLVLAAFVIASLAAASLVARGFEWPVYRLLTGRQLT